MELQLASYFIDRNIPFTKGESPDFTAAQNGQQIGIECTSVHYQTIRPTNKALFDKIGKAINAKAKKNYAARNFAVFIDVTHVHSFSTDSDNLLGDPVGMRNYLRNKLTRTSYGSVILSTYVYEDTPSLSWASASRVDSPNASPELCAFLDTAFGSSSDLVVIQNAKVPSSV